jgi:hypothetical protein
VPTSSTDYDADMMNALTVADTKKIGGLILSGFKPHEIRMIKDNDVKKELFRAIGLVPLAELMPVLHPERLQNLTLEAVEGRTSLAFEDLDQLGTLAFFLTADKWGLASASAINNFVWKSLNLPHHKCICLPKVFAESFKTALVKAYG